MRRVAELFILIIIGLLTESTVHAQRPFWQLQTDYGGSLFGLDCLNPQDCFATGEIGLGLDTYILRTVDGGRSWSKVYTEKERSPFPWFPLRIRDIEYLTDQVAVVSADSGFILRTSNGGDSWYRIRIGDSAGSGPLSFCDTLNGAVILRVPFNAGTDSLFDRIMGTTDGGASWDTIPRPNLPEWERGPIDAFQCISPTTFLCFQPGNHTSNRFARTMDRGRTWTFLQDTILATEGIRGPSFFFLDSLNGWFSGIDADSNGFLTIVARTYDGGISWSVIHRNTLFKRITILIYQMIFTDTLNGVAGASGTVLRTSDGGVTWGYDSTNFPLLNTPVFISGITQHNGVAAQAYGALARRVEDISDVAIRWTAGQPPTVSIYPNPVSRSAPLRIRLGTDEEAEISVSLDDILGHQVATMKKRDTEDFLSLDISHLPPGIYFVRVTVDGVSTVQSLQVL